MAAGNKGTIVQVYGNGSGPKRTHECYLCKIYRYEIAKGNKDAYKCYVSHLNYLVKRDNGVSIKIKSKKERKDY